MTCHCGSKRIIKFSGKCGDMCETQFHNTKGQHISSSGYVPSDLNIGSGDYINFKFCADCGRIQNFTAYDDDHIEEALA
jgi:hypothetical protein